MQRRENSGDGGRLVPPGVHFQQHPGFRRQCATQEHGQLVDLGLPARISPGAFIGNQLGRGLQIVSTMRRLLARRDEPVSVNSTMASTSSGALTSVAPPGKLHFRSTPWRSRNRRVSPTASRGDALARQVRYAADGRIVRHAHYPADGTQALLGINQIGHFHHVAPFSTIQSYPVMPASSRPCST